MIQDNNLFEDINSLPPKEKAEVIDLVKRLKNKLKSKNQTSQSEAPKESAVLKLAGTLPGPSITSREIDEELYG